jgi:predicted S18 family serine protease
MTHPVLQCEEIRREAMNTSNTDAFRQFCDPAMIYRHSTGAVDDLNEYIHKIESKQVKYTNVVFEDMTVILPQNNEQKTALVMGHMYAEAIKPTETIHIRSHFQTTWLQVGDQWKLLAVHSALMPPAAK